MLDELKFNAFYKKNSVGHPMTTKWQFFANSYA